MAESAGKTVNIFTAALGRLVDQSVEKKVMNALGVEAIKIIVRRTRLGKTARRTRVKNELGEIKNKVVTLKQIKPHSAEYTEFRKQNKRLLHKFTRPTRQNLTLSGQLLFSVGIKRVSKRQVIIGPNKEKRRPFLPEDDSPQLTNEQLGSIVTSQGRPFLELSTLDDKKLVRFYRRQFSDLRKRFGKTL